MKRLPPSNFLMTEALQETLLFLLRGERMALGLER